MKKLAYAFTAMLATLSVIIDENKGRFSVQFVKNWSEKKIKPRNFADILRKEVVVGNTTQLLDSETRIIKGISTYSGTRLKEGTGKVISGIRISYGQDDESGQESLVNYTSSAPSDVRNGMLVISQDGSDILRYPLSEILNRNSAKTIDEDYLDLDYPIVLVDNQDIEIRIDFPKGAKPHATKKEYLEFATRGIEFVRATA